MARHTYEVIKYEQTNYLFSVGQLTYVVPHIHREMEIALVLEGDIELIVGGERHTIHPGDFWLMNPCQCHELYSTAEDRISLFLELQVSPSFFKYYYRDIERLHLDQVTLKGSKQLAGKLLHTASDYFEGRPFYELRCAGDIDHLLVALLEAVPYTIMNDDELRIYDFRMNRMQRITDYIEEHISEKLLLTDLADRENLTLNYISHFFKANFGMPFQTYVQHLRCRKAASLLIETDATPTDISIQCGFSALKYMNQSFRVLFGCKPAEYRIMAAGSAMNEDDQRGKPSYDMTLSPHLSSKEALTCLRRYL